MLSGDLFEFAQHRLECWGVIAFGVTGSQGAFQHASCAVTQRERVGEHIDHVAYVHSGLKTRRRNEGVERKGRERSSRREHVHLGLHLREKMASGTFPIQKEKRNPFIDQLKKEMKHHVGLAGARSPEDGHVL